MKNLFYFLVFSLSLTSCSQTYTPTAIHTPIFSNQGELQIRAVAGANGFDPQVSYAVTDHFGLMANGSFSQSDKDVPEADAYKKSVGEIGLGLYNNTNGKFVYEIFGGAGGGILRGDFMNSLNETYKSDASVTRIFLQPALGFVTDVFDISLGLRFSSLNIKPDIVSDLNTQAAFLEPALSVGLGYKYVKLHVQIGSSNQLNNENTLAYTYEPLIFNVSLAARLGRKYF